MQHPPTLAELLQNEDFRAMMKKRPRLPEAMSHGKPWRVWIHTDRNTWLTKELETYDEAWKMALGIVRNEVPAYRDVSIVSKRVLFAPPAMNLEAFYKQLYTDLGARHLKWCTRCRRPSQFRASDSGHHALRKLPVAVIPDNRCFFCGITTSGQPRHAWR